jgi:NAD(P)-dependent dehydrogenase (short-subunit alcohol dehydrogenase family)
VSDLFSLKDKVVAITGGSGFLGQQYARALEEAGAIVAIWDFRDVSRVVDITNREHVQKEVDLMVKEYGHLDVLIHNAALNPAPGVDTNDFWAPYESAPLDIWRKELEVNLTGAQIVTQAVAPVMMKQRSGSIIFVASDIALIAPNNSIYPEGNFKDIAYVASKAGVLGLMRAWASRLGPYNVRVNALVPGGMYRNHDPEFAKKNGALNMLGRMAQPGEFNGAVLLLASDASSFMTGSCLVIDGGRTAW